MIREGDGQMRFQNKVVLISGGGTGIGKATALAFAKEGAKIAICGRRKEPLEVTVSEIKRQGGEAAYFICDVSKSADAERVIMDAVAKYGRVDILFNNAGVNRSQPIEKTTDADVNALFEINVKGHFWMLRAIVAQMRKQGGGGAIVNMSSMSGLMGHPNRVAYCASKGAIVNMTRALALEVAGDGIRVNSVCPGVIQTPMLDEGMKEAPDITQGYVDSTPLKRIADAAETARAVLFLASDEASYITGVNLPVDGGFTAGK
jgi:NAD(P)-dependent dehydrogenase (short-subunit alcohol dehydrogenase family)